MERYKEYKKSVVPGMKEIPSHWKEILNGFLFKENVRKPNENDIPLSLSQKDGLIPTDLMKESSLKTSTYDNWKKVLKHDLVLNRFKAHLGVLMASDYEGMVSFHYGVYEPQLPLITKYYELLYHTDIYKGIYAYSSNGMTVGLQNLSNIVFYSIKGIYPPLAEQEKIVSYLEDKTSKIDAYVADKEKEIELLQELKQKTIADAVTKGLNPDAKMKDSGISWIGEIPEHWEVCRMKRVFSEAKEKTISEEGTLLSLSQYTGITLKDDAKKVGMFEAESTIGYNVVHPGQFVMNIMLAWNGSYAVSDYEGIISPSYCVFNFNEDCEKKYFHYLLRLPAYAGAFKTMSKGIIESRLRLYPIYFLAFKTIIPPQDEQQAIVAYIEEKCEKIDKLASELQSEIDYLKEYKQRLIADCVTGQVNVQNI